MRFHTAVNKFCWQAILGQPISVWKTAMHQMRPYLDLEDGIEAITYALDTKLFTNQIYNVVTLNATVSDILESIRVKFPDLKTEFVDSPIMNQLSYKVSNEKFKKLGFLFKGNLKRGILETLELLLGCNRI
jgi:nucleoside-diphosphate-sugar epimerase